VSACCVCPIFTEAPLAIAFRVPSPLLLHGPKRQATCFMLPSSIGRMLVLVFEVNTNILRRATMDLKCKRRKDYATIKNEMVLPGNLKGKIMEKKEQIEDISSVDMKLLCLSTIHEDIQTSRLL
jgi:hypothetical protein